MFTLKTSTIRSTISFLSLFLTASIPLHAQTPKVDLSSVTTYWQLTDHLQQNNTLPDSLWNRFVNLPATQLTVKGRGIDLPVLREALGIVYAADQQTVKQTLLADSSEAFNLKRYYVQLHSKYQRLRPEIEVYAKQAQSGRLLNNAYGLTYQLLPTHFRQTNRQVPALEVYYSPLFEGGYADGKQMVLAIETELAFKDTKPNVLVGHELHHLLRPQATLKGRTQTDDRLLNAFSRLLDEGIADLVGISPTMYKTIKPTESVSQIAGDDPFLWYLAGADSVLTELNTSLTRYHQTKDTSWVSDQRLDMLLVSSGGHVPSGFMGHVIDRNGFRPQLIRQLSNPFAFIRLYNQAARNDPSRPPLFSPDALALVARLEKQYWPSKSVVRHDKLLLKPKR